MLKSYLESYVNDIYYEELNDWIFDNISYFSKEKPNLYFYQVEAIKNASKALHSFYTNSKGIEEFYKSFVSLGMDKDDFKVDKYRSDLQKSRGIINERYTLLEPYFDVENESISGKNFLNRMAFWMATGSGKSIVIIKMIDYLSELQLKKLIPQKDIMLLIPRDDLFEQINQEVQEYNRSHSKGIRLVNLKKYEEDKNDISLLKENDITVYYYRSDLIRDERKESLIDFRDYENNGNWYIILDEAHRGETGQSLLQDYISIMSRNGFLFNFSATFTDQIDYATTCFNFNLEKFIEAGYGKKIYLSSSTYNFKNSRDDFSEMDKQKEVIKSLLNLTLIKKNRDLNYYHNPLMITLVNSVNTEESDLLLFFKKLEEFSNGTIDNSLFEQAKLDFIRDFNNDNYLIGDKKITISAEEINNISIEDILYHVYNSSSFGKIEILEGEAGKEIALKLETSEKPFALIKIGDTAKFQRDSLGNNYVVSKTYYNKSYFKDLNSNDDINILMGSRSFYEGWDSNRPNVINFINIGGQNATKYVLQAIGRGVRIEPTTGQRKRLPQNDSNKNELLETLFVYATDRKGLETVISTLDEQKSVVEVPLNIQKNQEIGFDLLIPKFKNTNDRNIVSYFPLAAVNIKEFTSYFKSYNKELMLLKYNIDPNIYDIMLSQVETESIFQINNERYYTNYETLLHNLIEYISYVNKELDTVKVLDNEIIHFEHIKLVNDRVNKNISEREINELNKIITQISNFDEKTLKDKIAKLASLNDTDGILKLIEDPSNQKNVEFKDLQIIKLANHYYYPLIISFKEKVSYIRNIISVESEVNFVSKLMDYIEKEEITSKWMFSKINEKTDNLYIPYFSKEFNKEKKFFPDFIFWTKKDNDYNIIFIDPKGTRHSDYIFKIEEFERIFFSEGNPKVFKYKDLNVRFNLKMITKDLNLIPEQYKSFWVNEDDFSWLK